MGKIPVPHSFLCWMGGKTKITDELLRYKPPQFNTYHEPFLGSGALFFRLVRDKQIKRAVLSDINSELIDTYLAVRDHPQEIFDILASFPYSKEFFYELRAKDPYKLQLTERAARMIYLNKTSHGCKYRVNKKGQFNSSFGYNKKPAYLDKENLFACSAALKDVEILCTSFESVLERAQPSDWIYFDPPYVPLSLTSNFTKYTPDGFDLKQHKELRDLCIKLTDMGIYVLVSNSNSIAVRILYDKPMFSMHEIWALRTINAYTSNRGKIRELVITNFPTTTSNAGSV